jgi:hypothetical protein
MEVREQYTMRERDELLGIARMISGNDAITFLLLEVLCDIREQNEEALQGHRSAEVRGNEMLAINQRCEAQNALFLAEQAKFYYGDETEVQYHYCATCKESLPLASCSLDSGRIEVVKHQCKAEASQSVKCLCGIDTNPSTSPRMDIVCPKHDGEMVVENYGAER